MKKIIVALLVVIMLTVAVVPVSATDMGNIVWTAWGLNDKGQSFSLTGVVVDWTGTYPDGNTGYTVDGRFMDLTPQGQTITWHVSAPFPGCYPGSNNSGQFYFNVNYKVINTTFWCPKWYPTGP
jgi:hypothetical protein